MQIAIIGNSIKCLSQESGSFIDSCDKVIRINNFVIEPYEKYIGSKTTHISLMITGEGATSGILGNDYLLNLIPNKVNKILIPDKFRSEHLSQIERAKQHFQLPELAFNFIDSIVYDDLYDEMREYCLQRGDIRDHYYPDSGITNIVAAFHRYPDAKIYVKGFDPGREYPGQYYWTKECLNYHPQKAELAKYNQLKLSGRVFDL
jgi:hypothetical protein